MSWSAPDNGDGSPCGSYLVKYSSTTTLLSDSDFTAAATFFQSMQPLPRGTTEYLVVTGLIPNATYWFSVKASSASTWGPLSNGATCQAGMFYLIWSSTENSACTHMTTGDFNGDGYTDIFISNYGAFNTRLFSNNAGNGTFTPTTQTSHSGEYNNGIESADFDNDGDLDILIVPTGNWPQTIRIKRNDATTAFSTVWTSTETAYWKAAGTGDFNNDGLIDFAIGTGSNLYLFQNTGNFQFVNVWTSTATMYVNSVQFADVDRDGDLDIVSGCSGDNVIVYRNNRNGVFAQTNIDGYTIHDVKTGDYNNDGNLDLGMTNWGFFMVLSNNGAGIFSTIYNNGSEDAIEGPMEWGDFDNDGLIDIAIKGSGTPVRLYRNFGNGNFYKIWISTIVNSDNAIGVLDYDNDGDLDLVTTSSDRNVRIYKNLTADYGTVNTAPAAPSTGFGASMNSSGELTFRWDAASDSGAGTTPSAALNYSIKVSSISGGNSTISGCISNGRSSYTKPTLSSSQLGLWLNPDRLRDGTTYYWSVRTIDNGQRASAWSVEQSTCYNCPPSPVSSISAVIGSQIALTWSAPGDNAYSVLSGTAAVYDIRYSSAAPFDWNTATIWKSARPVSGQAGTVETESITGLKPGTTYYFYVKTRDTYGNWSSLSVGATAQAGTFREWQTLTAYSSGFVAFGDYDNDGAQDFAVGGWDGSVRILRIYHNDGSGNFTLAFDLAGIDWTSNGAWGDYDNDGLLDLAVCGMTNSGRVVRIYHNNVTSFTDIAAATTGVAWGNVVWGDFDNDGDLDLLASGQNASSQYMSAIYTNTSGSFAARDITFSNYEYYGLNTADFNHDGFLDILVAEENRYGGALSQSINIYPYTNGAYPLGQRIDNWGAGVQPKPADLNGDGYADFMIQGWNGYGGRISHVYKNTAGTFAYESLLQYLMNGGGEAVGDIYNTGYPAIISSGQTSAETMHCYLYRNNSPVSLTFTAIQELLPYKVNEALADIDGDGDLDMIVTGVDGGSEPRITRVYKSLEADFGNANSAPTPPVAGFATAIDTATGNVEITWSAGSDSKTPAASLNYSIRVGTTTASNGLVSGVFGTPFMGNYRSTRIAATTPGIRLVDGRLQDGTSYYWSVQSVDSGLRSSAWSAEQVLYYNVPPGTITDLTACTSSQIVLTWTAPGDDGYTGYCSGYSIRYSSSLPFDWAAATVWKANRAPSGAAGTREIEMVTGLKPATSYYFYVEAYDDAANYATLSAGTTAQTGWFYTIWNTAETDQNSVLTAADFDNNGYIDYACSDPTYDVRIFLNNGSAVFSNPWNSSTAGRATAMASGDFNNDGWTDIATCGYFQTLRVYRNSGAGAFTEIWTGVAADSATCVTWGDFNNDGLADLVTACDGGSLRYYRNTGNNTFSVTFTLNLSERALGISCGDYNNDGYLDLVIANYGQPNRVIRNLGNETFDNPWSTTETDISMGVNWFDYDNDGYLDILVANTYQPVRVYKNNHSGGFALTWTSTETNYAYQAVCGDFDNDGDIDFALANESAGAGVRIYHNNGNDTFTMTDAPSVPDPKHNIVAADFDADGDLDIITASNNGPRNTLLRNTYADFGAVNSAPNALISSALQVTYDSGYHVFTWNAGADGQTTAAGLLYAARIGTVSRSSNTVSAAYGSPLMGTYLRPKVTDAQLGLKLKLLAETSYYWQVRVIDAGLRKGPWNANEQIGFLNVAPSAISTLSVAPGNGSVTLNWTAPGDDGNSFTNSGGHYVVRYSTQNPIDSDGRFTAATDVANNWVPLSPGTTETHSVTGLPEGTYYFGIKTRDKGNNYSGLSNAPSGNALGLISKLIFLTTTQTLMSGATSPMLTVQALDQYDHPVISTENVTLTLAATSTNAQFSSTGAEPWGVSIVTLPSGGSTANFYYRDYVAGTSTITVSCASRGWQSTQLRADIQAGPATHFDITHDGSAQVLTAEPLTIVARDQYNNLTTGYTGTALFASTGSVTFSYTSHTFTTGDLGSYVLQVSPSKIETLLITATDASTGTITGTSPALPVTGMYVFGSTSLTGTEIFQQQVSAPMLRFDLKTSGGTTVINRIRVDRSGTATNSDILRAKIYRDDGDGTFSSTADVLIGSAAFTGSGRSDIDIPSETISTALKIFYVAYDMSNSAVEGNTAGARIENVSYLTVASGQPMGTNNLPISCSTATIIATARTVTVNPESSIAAEVVQGQSNITMMKLQIASDLGPVTWSQLRINKLGSCSDADIRGIALWADDSGDGLYGSGDRQVSSGTLTSGSITFNFTEGITVSTKTYFFVADISQSAGTGITFGLECSAANYFTVNSPHHVSGAFPIRTSTTTIVPTTDILTVTPENVAPAQILQGSTTVRMVKLTMSVNANATLWSAIRIDRTGTGSDGDVVGVKVLKDDLSLISAGNDAFVSGSANVILSQVQTISAGQNKVYYLAVDYSPTGQLGKTIGLRCAATGYFTLSLPDYTTGQNIPFESNATEITEYPDTVVMVSSSIAPATVSQAAENVAVLRMSARTSFSSAIWSRIRLNRSGSNTTDADITSVRIYRDLNANNSFDQSDSLITPTTCVFTAGILDMTLSQPQTISASTQTYFVTLSISNSAPPNGTIGIRVIHTPDANSMVNYPNTVSSAGFPFDSTVMTVNEPASVVTVSGETLAPSQASQGAYFAGMMKLRLKTDIYTATWRTAKINLTGTAADTDIAAIRIYRDEGDGAFNKDTDQPVSAGTDVFSLQTAYVNLTTLQTLTTTWQTYYVVYDIKETATPGATCGAELTSAGFITLDTPDTVSSANFPVTSGVSTILATVDTVNVTLDDAGVRYCTQTDTATVLQTMTLSMDAHQAVWTALKVNLIGTGTDTDLTGVRIYRDENANGRLDVSTDTLISPLRPFASGLATIPLINPETLTTTQKKYLISVDVSQTATPGATIGVRIADSASLTVTAPDIVSLSTAAQTESSLATILDQPDAVTAYGLNLAGATVDQNKISAPFLRIGLRVDHDAAYLTRLKINKLGTLDETKVSSVRFIADTNATGVLEAATDVLVASGTLTGDQVTLSFAGQLITTTTRYYFIACDIALEAPVNETLGFQVAAAASLTLGSPDTVSATNLPAGSSLSRIRDIRTPTTPEVTDDGDFTYNFEQVSAIWYSEVIAGQIVDAQYAIGTTTATTDILAWTTNGTATTFTAKGLSLQNAKTYYIMVKAKSNYGFWSDVGISDGITVDLVEPQVSVAPSVIKGEQTYMITWPPAATGVSGVAEYALMERTGYRPKWVVVSTKTATAEISYTKRGIARRRLSSPPPNSHVFVDKTANTYYYRVRALNGAGKWSDFSPAIRVLFGSLPTAILTEVCNYPNPFDSRSERTTIHYYLNQDTNVTIRLYDLYGHFLREIKYASGSTGAMTGSNEVTWDGTDKDGAKVSMGGYIAIITTDAKGEKNEVRFKIAVIH